MSVVGVALQNPAHMRHPSPPHGVGQMSPHPMHGHMMPQMGQVCLACRVCFISCSVSATLQYFLCSPGTALESKPVHQLSVHTEHRPTIIHWPQIADLRAAEIAS